VIFLAYFIPAAFWLVCKPFLYDAKKGRELGYRLSRFKNNEETFKSLLTKQKQIKGQVADLGILIGPSEARNNIIKVCNPFCGPCAEAHPKIEHLIENKDDWNLRVIFTTSADETLRAFKPVTHFMAIASEEGPLEIKKALTDWYSDPEKNYEAFASRHPIKTQPELQKTKLTAMRDWCEEEGVQSTPTIYVNGYRLPEHYRIEELDFL
jgi:thiol-disulfide isomerase/thioredoxin